MEITYLLIGTIVVLYFAGLYERKHLVGLLMSKNYAEYMQINGPKVSPPKLEIKLPDEQDELAELNRIL